MCSGGIIGMGEDESDRVGLIHTLATLPAHPESVPINALVPVEGTPLQKTIKEPPTALELVRCVAVARIVMPKSMVRLSAGRNGLSMAEQVKRHASQPQPMSESSEFSTMWIRLSSPFLTFLSLPSLNTVVNLRVCAFWRAPTASSRATSC